MNYRYVVFAYAVSLLCLPVILRAAQAELSPMDKKIKKQMSTIAKSSKDITFDGKKLKLLSRPGRLACAFTGGCAAFTTWLASRAKLVSHAKPGYFAAGLTGFLYPHGFGVHKVLPPEVETIFNLALRVPAVVVGALCAYMFYKRFNPDVSLALTKKKIAIPGRSNVHWHDVKQLGVKNTYRQAEYTTKTHINMTLKNDNKVQIDTAVLPIHYDPVYNLMSDLVTHNA